VDVVQTQAASQLSVVARPTMSKSSNKVYRDNFGNVKSLREYGNDLKPYISAAEVAECVKVIRLESFNNNIKELPYEGDLKNMGVNLIVGLTGSGKTSMVRMLAGGMPVPESFSSDTKAPTVYVLHCDGVDYAFLDTAGLCDTQAETNSDKDLQELLINAVAATIKNYELRIVKCLLTIGFGQRMPGRFAETWPGLQNALGGAELNNHAMFCVTMANKEGRMDRGRLQTALDDTNPRSFFNTLKHSTLGWPVVTVGQDNTEDLVQRIVSMSGEQTAGITADMVKDDVKSLDRKRTEADEMKDQIAVLREALSATKDPAKMQDQMDELNDKIVDLKVAIAGASCTQSTDELQKDVNWAIAELAGIKAMKCDTVEDQTVKVGAIKDFDRQLKIKMEAIRADEFIGSFWKSLAQGARAMAGASGY